MKLISRRGALQAIASLKSDYDCDYNKIVEKCHDAVKRLPIHSDERKTGKWIITARNGVLCSECKSGTRKMPMLFGKPLYKYCPFCGLPMEVPDVKNL